MKPSDLKSHDTVAEQRRTRDVAYAAESNRLALAGAVATAVVHYRGARGLTQTQLGDLVGIRQPHVARLERGDVMPSVKTLERLVRAGVMEVHFERESTYVQVLATV